MAKKCDVVELTWDEVLEWIARPWRGAPSVLQVVDVWPNIPDPDPRLHTNGALRICGEPWLYFDYRTDGLVTWWATNRDGHTYNFDELRKEIKRARKIHQKEISSRYGYVDKDEIPGF